MFNSNGFAPTLALSILTNSVTSLWNAKKLLSTSGVSVSVDLSSTPISGKSPPGIAGLLLFPNISHNFPSLYTNIALYPNLLYLLVDFLTVNKCYKYNESTIYIDI